MLKTGFAALAVCALATPALADTPQDPFAQQQVTLRLDGLDLATVDGQQRLAIRMDAAARAVCGDGLDTVHPYANARAQECRAEVLARTRDQIQARLASRDRGVTLAMRD
ncbi:UrcA family protein [Novosphingobium aquimarinum]|uniref:UrcA family protein n=1 Tax=Novosphingobium aquimarinum TaxID=2682494 RepID=UPI001E607654|nr:UrcA family protein [Novosphingobium aquimarinum]